MDLTGLAKGGQQIQNCRIGYQKLVRLLVKLASLQTSFQTLDEAIKATNRRVNALENVVKPRLENTITYIKVVVLWLSIEWVGGRAFFSCMCVYIIYNVCAGVSELRASWMNWNAKSFSD